MVEDCGGGAGAGSLFVAGMYVIPFADIAVFNPVGIGSLLGRHALGVAHFLPGPTSALVGWVEKVGKLDDKEGEGGVAEALAPVSDEGFHQVFVLRADVDIRLTLIPYDTTEWHVDKRRYETVVAVSYTHLTLPTI